MLVEPLLFLLPGHDLVLESDPRVLINHKYFKGGRAEPMNGVRLDLADAQHILKDSLLDFPLIFVALLFVLQIRGIGELLKQIGEIGLMMKQMDSVAVPPKLFVIRHDVDIEACLLFG